jgi:hypothetical protein
MVCQLQYVGVVGVVGVVAGSSGGSGGSGGSGALARARRPDDWRIGAHSMPSGARRPKRRRGGRRPRRSGGLVEGVDSGTEGAEPSAGAEGDLG